MQIVEFVEYATIATDRLLNQYRKQLKSEPDLVSKPYSNQLAFDLL